MGLKPQYVDLESILLSEVSQTERQISHDIIYMWNLINDTNDLVYKKRNRHTDTENKLMVTKGERWGER